MSLFAFFHYRPFNIIFIPLFCSAQAEYGAKVEFCEWMDGACSRVAVSSEGSSTAAFHFTGSEESGSVRRFNTYLPWAGVCACEYVCMHVRKHGFIRLVFLNIVFVHFVCVCVCVCVEVL